MKLRISRATIEEFPWYPKKDQPGGNSVMVVTAPLDLKLAEALRCKEMCFDGNGVPRAFENEIGLTIRITNAAVELGDKVYKSPLTHKLKVGRKPGAADNNIGLFLTIRMHFAGDDFDLIGWSRSVNDADFAFTIEPPQGEFEFNATEEAADDGQEPITEHLTGAALASHREMQQPTRQGKRAN